MPTHSCLLHDINENISQRSIVFNVMLIIFLRCPNSTPAPNLILGNMRMTLDLQALSKAFMSIFN